MIAIASIKGKGEGLVATRKIKKGEHITSGPIKTFPAGALSGTPIYDLVWWKGKKDALTLAAHTLCNDSPNPNCKCKIINGMDTLIAKRKIKKGEELTLNYRELFG